MPLIVEDGTGMLTSNSFINVADADTFFASRNNPAAWVAATALAKEAALLQAGEYLNWHYRWRGSRVALKQAMEWPRYLPVDDDYREVDSNSVPQRVKDAQCLLALEVLTNGDLMPSLDRGGAVVSESVGPISVTYSESASPHRTFPRIDALLRDLSDGSGNSLTQTAVRA